MVALGSVTVNEETALKSATRYIKGIKAHTTCLFGSFDWTKVGQ